MVRKLAGALPLFLLLTACRRDMFVQPKSNPLKASDFFSDGGASRPLPAHTVARGHLETNEAYFAGMIGTNLVTTLPMPVTMELLARGRERFDINCSPCHGRTGQGNGMIVRRGFPAPPTFHQERLRSAPIGHFFHVMTHGYGVMYSYASHVDAADRWAIAAYIRALQLSRDAPPADAPPSERARLESR